MIRPSIQPAFELSTADASAKLSSNAHQAIPAFNKRNSRSILFHEGSSFVAYLAAIDQIASAIPNINPNRSGFDKLIR
jgi:hypothetical protein